MYGFFLAWGLIQKHDKMFALNSSNSIIEFLLEGTPVVLENSVDSRRLVDQTLKESCQTFINHSSNTLVSPLTIFLDEVCFKLLLNILLKILYNIMNYFYRFRSILNGVTCKVYLPLSNSKSLLSLKLYKKKCKKHW